MEERLNWDRIFSRYWLHILAALVTLCMVFPG